MGRINMNPPITIIGLVGHKQSGKDTVWSIISKFSASYLTTCPCFRFSFADGLKHEVAAQLDTTVEWIESHKSNPLVRHALQWYGTEFRRTENNNYWIEQLAKYITTFNNSTGHTCIILVVTDVRFPNEAAYIKQQGGLLFRIRRKVADDVEDKHESERHVDDIACDNFIHNDMSFLRLENEVKDVLRQHKLLKV